MIPGSDALIEINHSYEIMLYNNIIEYKVICLIYFQMEVSRFDLEKEAERLFRDKEYERAEQIFLQLIGHPTYSDQIGRQTLFRKRIAKCRYYSRKYKEAGDILMEACTEIIRFDNTLLGYGLGGHLKEAYGCYKLAGMQEKCDEILQNTYLSPFDKRTIDDLSNLFKY